MLEIKDNSLYYTENTRKIFKSDAHKGYRYFVVSIGTHPTAYIELSSEEIKKPWEEIIHTHGGITYWEKYCYFYNNQLIGKPLIGWDYGHAQDMMMLRSGEIIDGYIWSVEEIEKDCHSVIEQVIAELNKER